MNRDLAMNLALLFGILVVVNLPAPWLGLSFSDGEKAARLWYEPPGWIIPLVWWVLFTLMAVARYELGKVGTGQSGRKLIVGLAVLCASYAYYTLGLTRLTGISSLWFGLFGNLLVIACALFITFSVAAVSVVAARLILPIVIWTAYATAIVVGQLRAQRLL